MLTYRVRPRFFKLQGTALPQFPVTAEVTFHFAPDQTFGCSPGGGRTAVRAKPARAYFDANTGQSYVENLSGPLMSYWTARG